MRNIPADNTQAPGQRQQPPILIHITYHKNYKKIFSIPVFLHQITVWKRLYIIPLLCERKMYANMYILLHIYVNVKMRSNGEMNLHLYYLRLSDTEKTPPRTKKIVDKNLLFFFFFASK